MEVFTTRSYYTNFLILLVKNMLCSNVHDQKSFTLIIFSYKILDSQLGGLGDAEAWLERTELRLNVYIT